MPFIADTPTETKGLTPGFIPDEGSSTSQSPSFLGKLGESLQPTYLGIPKAGTQVLSKVLNLPSNILGGATKAGRETMTGEYQPPKIGPTFQLGKDKEFNLGKLVHPAAVGAVRGVMQNQTVMQELPKTVGVDPNSLPGLAIGMAGEIATPDVADVIKFGDIAKTLVGKAGKSIREGGEEFLLKALKANPSQITKFEQKTGKKLVDFMIENKLTGDFAKRATEKLDQLQEGFDSIAVESGAKIKLDSLKNAFQEATKEFSASVLPELKTKAKAVTDVYDEIAAKFAGQETGVDVGELTGIRRQVDGLLKEGQFSLLPEQASYLRAVRDALQSAVQKATEGITVEGKNLKQLGLQIRDIIQFEKIAERQANLGRGANPLGIIKPLTSGVGGVVGNLPGAAAGYLIGAASQSPTVLSTISRGIQQFGKGIEKSTKLPKILETVLRSGKEAAIKTPVD